MQEIIFKKDYMPQFREADADGLIGPKGYMSYFQDAATHYMHNLRLGNDTLPEERGAVWLYTKYKLHIEKKADFCDEGLHFEVWVERSRPSARLWQDLVISRGTEIYARGRVELCLLHLQTGKPGRIADIDYPFETASDRRVGLPPFRKFDKTPARGQYCYTYTVRYTDLDKSMHMNNLLYVYMLLDALPSSFYQAHFITGLEIQYVKQCYEGEEIHIYKSELDGGVLLVGEKADGQIAVQGMLAF